MLGIRPYHRTDLLGGYDLFKEMDDFDRRFWGGERTNFKTDIIDNGEEFVLEAELPGFKKEDIHIDVSGGYLTISATREDKKEEKNEKGEYVRRERSYGTFSRSFDISAIDEKAIGAAFENGVLKLTLPKLQEEKPTVKRIEIQ